MEAKQQYLSDGLLEDLHSRFPWSWPPSEPPRSPPQDDYNMQQVEVAAVLGISRQRVQQLEVNGLRKLERWCKERGLQLSDFIG